MEHVLHPTCTYHACLAWVCLTCPPPTALARRACTVRARRSRGPGHQRVGAGTGSAHPHAALEEAAGCGHGWCEVSVDAVVLGYKIPASQGPWAQEHHAVAEQGDKAGSEWPCTSTWNTQPSSARSHTIGVLPPCTSRMEKWAWASSDVLSHSHWAHRVQAWSTFTHTQMWRGAAARATAPVAPAYG